MATELRRIPVRPGTELARLLDEVKTHGTPVLLEADGKLYRLSTEEDTDIWADYDPEKVREALRHSAGALKDVDRDKLINDLRAQRA